jgi:Pao retrotransposon peptidase.
VTLVELISLKALLLEESYFSLHKECLTQVVLASLSLCPKLLLQERWKSKLGWDKEVTEELSKKFTKWAKELPKLATLKLFGGFP